MFWGHCVGIKATGGTNALLMAGHLRHRKLLDIGGMSRPSAMEGAFGGGMSEEGKKALIDLGMGPN